MKAKAFAFVFTFLFAATALSNEKKCEPLRTPVKYKIEKNDYVAAILRKFNLEPVFGKNKSMDQTLRLNNLKKADSVSVGDSLLLPFPCEQDAQKWVLKPGETKEFRWIGFQKATIIMESAPVEGSTASEIKSALDGAKKAQTEATVAAAIAAKAAMTKAAVEGDQTDSKNFESQTMDSRLREIISPPLKQVDPESVEGKLEQLSQQKKNGPKKDEVSDALRYRMICDGEWVGDQCIPRYSMLYTSLAGWFNRYDGTDPSVAVNNQGVLLSRFNPELTLGWSHYWSKNVKSVLQASFKKTSMLPEAREVPIEQDEKLLTNFLAEIRYETGVWGIGLGLKQFDKLFYRFRFSGLNTPCIGGTAGFTGCGIVVHSASVSMFYGDVSWLFYQAGKFSSDLLFTLGYLGSSTTAGWEIKPGTAWNLEFRVQHDRVQEFLFGSVSYGQSKQDTSIELQTASELGLTVGYAWKLKDW